MECAIDEDLRTPQVVRGLEQPAQLADAEEVTELRSIRRDTVSQDLGEAAVPGLGGVRGGAGHEIVGLGSSQVGGELPAHPLGE
jgi:hypothetical protein